MFRPWKRKIITLPCAIFWAVMTVAAVGAKEPQGGANKLPENVAKKLSGPMVPAEDDYYQLLEVFVDSLDQIERNYVKDLSRRELVEAAIEGMVSRLDQHSSYIPPKDVAAFRSGVENKFGGIGINVVIEDGKLKVISPLVGAPAYQQGVLAGDHIVEIEGESTKDITLDGAVSKLKGEVGTNVTITVQASPGAELRKITITRAVVRVESVVGARRNADDTWNFLVVPDRGIGYVRIDSFSHDTARDLRQALKKLQAQNLRGLILDLRLNPGGLLTSAIEVCDAFIRDGLIVSTKGRNTKERSWSAKAAGTFEGFPMAILINRYSASASEIVAACLQDHGRAVVVGERSFGKGSVQNVIDLEEGRSVLKLTTASYRRPNGHNIHRFPDSQESDEWGVKPNANYEVELSTEELQELVTYRRRQHIAHGKSEPAATPATPVPAKDDQPKSTDAKTEGADTNKPDANNPDAKNSDTGSDADAVAPVDKGADNGPGPTGDGARTAAAPAAPAVEKPFQDRQLARALEYLSGELARAEIKK